VCYGTRGVVLCKSRDVKRVEHAGGVLNAGGKVKGGEGGKKGYIYSSSCNLIHVLQFVGNEHNTAEPSSCTTTEHFMKEEHPDDV
jgi:hypothetical protein